jgi:hypothetical protein
MFNSEFKAARTAYSSNILNKAIVDIDSDEDSSDLIRKCVSLAIKSIMLKPIGRFVFFRDWK